MDKSDYGDFCVLYGQAEHYLKRLERYDPADGLLIPAVNELRYAGCHIKRSIEAKDEAGYRLHITSAERHCKRSICDSISTIIGHVNASLYDVRTSYFFVPIADYVGNHASMLAEVGKAIEFVDEHTHDEDREAIECHQAHEHADGDEWPYEHLSKTLDRLLEIKAIYDAARPDLIRAARKFALTIILMFVTGSLGALATVVVYFLSKH